jgi:hypothetical protein
MAQEYVVVVVVVGKLGVEPVERCCQSISIELHLIHQEVENTCKKKGWQHYTCLQVITGGLSAGRK